MSTEPQTQVDDADALKDNPDALSNQTLATPTEAPKPTSKPRKASTAKPAKKASARKNAATRKAVDDGRKRTPVALKADGRKAKRVDDRPVVRSGLFSPTQDELNPAFAAPVEK